jgi:hypothetical protein
MAINTNMLSHELIVIRQMDPFAETNKILVELENKIEDNKNNPYFLETLYNVLDEKRKKILSLSHIYTDSKKYLDYLTDRKIKNKKVEDIFKNFKFDSFSFESRKSNFKIVLNNNKTDKLLINREYVETVLSANSYGTSLDSANSYGTSLDVDAHIDIKYGEYLLYLNKYYDDRKLDELCKKFEFNSEESKEFVEIFNEMIFTCEWYR